MPKLQMSRKEAILSEIEKLKRDKPQDWKRAVCKLIRELQWLLRDEDFREVFVNGDRMGYEQVGRKARSTRISPPV